MQTGKVVRPVGISMEDYKCLGNVGVTCLTNLFN